MAGQTIKIVGGFAIASISFGITLTVLNYLSTRGGSSSENSNATVIHVTDATYGNNCNGITTPSGSVIQVKLGNATAVLAKVCDNAKEPFTFFVDANKLGDMAPGCSKGFTASCGAVRMIRSITPVEPEANGKKTLLTCSVQK
jgi:hypothetical protein